MCAREDFALPELPPVCLKCGRTEPTSLYKVQYRHRGGNALTGIALLAGLLVTTTTTFMMKLPLCASCAAYRRYKTAVMLLLLPAVVGLFVPAFWYGLEYPVLFALPVIAGLVLLMFAAISQAAATPKAVRLTGDTLVIDVPGHGRLTLASPEDARAAAPPARRDAAPPLNRSVCGGCGFINFAGTAECKKCRAPLGHYAATV